MKKQYSVLMSVYKNEKPDALHDSMQSIYEQTVPTNDFILICDGPLTKQLDDVINEMQKKIGKRLRVIRLSENHGLGYCLRMGVGECKNDLVARMDADDVAVRERCEKELEVFVENPELSVVGGLVAEFEVTIEDVKSIRKVPEKNEEIIKFAKWRNPMNHPTVMFKKSDVLAVGNYPEIRRCQDYYLWVNMLMAGYNFYNIQEVLVNMREDKATFERRSGWQYFKHMKKLIDVMKEKKFISTPQYIATASLRLCSAMAPNWLRQSMFERFVREKVEK